MITISGASGGERFWQRNRALWILQSCSSGCRLPPPELQPDPRPEQEGVLPHCRAAGHVSDCSLHQGCQTETCLHPSAGEKPTPESEPGTTGWQFQAPGSITRGCRGWETIHLLRALLSSAKRVSGNLFCRVMGGLRGVSARGRAVRMLGAFSRAQLCW